jgi:hypothetical protein
MYFPKRYSSLTTHSEAKFARESDMSRHHYFKLEMEEEARETEISRHHYLKSIWRVT